MTSKIEFLLKYCLICFMLTACGKEGEIPDALKEILDRNGYQDISNSNGGGGSGGGGTVRYTGSYDQNVRSLLSKVSGWQTPSSLNASDAVAPQCTCRNQLHPGYLCSGGREFCLGSRVLLSSW